MLPSTALSSFEALPGFYKFNGRGVMCKFLVVHSRCSMRVCLYTGSMSVDEIKRVLRTDSIGVLEGCVCCHVNSSR